ncbi:MAG TPA: ATP-dependent Clp protease adaptor ClpS [Bacteroidia bacterium]|nr:ATP-dependent Clp protease adaptor ClpS [Bacteroidia bacterium]
MEKYLEKILTEAGISRQKQSHTSKESVSTSEERELVLYNDNHNTFQHVIRCLMEICKHDVLQAEQCTYLVHHSGKCVVKTGTYNFLKPFRDGLFERGLSAEIK